MNRVFRWPSAKWLGLLFLIIWILGALPPVLEQADLNRPAEIMRNIYRPVCHGIPGRCPAILGGPAAVCYRCSGLFLSLFLGCTVLYPLLQSRLKWEWSLKAALGATVLSGVQWLLEFLEWIPYSPWLTGITGLLWGGSLSLLLCSSLRRIRAKRN